MRSLVFRLLNYKGGHIGICCVSSAGRKCTREPKPQRDTASAFAYGPVCSRRKDRVELSRKNTGLCRFTTPAECAGIVAACIPHTLRSWMAWRLWKTGKRQDETRSSPSDAHPSIKQLLGMYLGGGSAPFAGWAAPGITFMPDVEPVLRNGVRGYQLALWFWLFAEKHGTIAAHMARESPSACSLRQRSRRPATNRCAPRPPKPPRAFIVRCQRASSIKAGKPVIRFVATQQQ
ncbi:hypothetical protein OKW46_001139 [Paraburkholderia sp. WSM4179]|nr:hypothetical protein [Paraburkholderia sp. WSM4179]